MDGFSRFIVYLYCSNNNTADTVLEFIQTGHYPLGLPSRVRSDRGGDNVGVCEYMIRHRGIDRASHIAGLSIN